MRRLATLPSTRFVDDSPLEEEEGFEPSVPREGLRFSRRAVDHSGDPLPRQEPVPLRQGTTVKNPSPRARRSL